VSASTQSSLVFFLTLGLFFAMPVIMFFRGQLLLGAIAAFFIQFIPIAWQLVAFPDDDAPGFAFLLLMTIPVSAGFILLGIADLVARLWGRHNK
jgi:hypothetical protein